MCQYKLTRTSPPQPCQAAEYIKDFAIADLSVAEVLSTSQLPIAADGLCIFHSKDIDWKLENNFHQWLDLLLAYIKHLDEATSTMAQTQISKEMSFAGFYLIGKEYELSNGKIETELRIKDLEIHGNIIWSWIETHTVDPLYFENLIMGECEINLNHALIEGEFHLSKVEIGQLSLNDTKLEGGLLMNDCGFTNYAEFGGVRINNICLLKDNHFATNAYFNASIFNCESILIDNCDFLGKTEFIGCSFKGDFSLENCEFEKELNFTNSKFFITASFTGNYYNDNVLFVSTVPTNKLFYDIVHFLFLDKEEEVQGRIIFEDINYSNILKEGRKELSDLERLDKVKIGSGCIKYRQQTPPITVKTDNINVNIAKELATSFSNYFTSSSGMNLGVEFINKSLHALTLFYFTDEDIDLDEFKARLQTAEENYWDFSVKDTQELSDTEIAQQIDSYVSKIALLTKMAMLREQHLWKDKQTANILKVIHFSDSAPNAAQINITINNYIDNRKINKNSMKIGKIIANEGSQVNIAEVIKNVKFNPKQTSISEEEFKQLKDLLLALKSEELNDLQVLVNNPSITNVTLYQTVKEKLDEFALKHGTPLIQGISASVIYDALKLWLNH